LTQNKEPSIGEELDNIFTIVVPVLGLVMMFSSRMIYNQLISRYDTSHNLLKKISYYRMAKIISWAMIESTCLLALLATMLTSNYLYIAVFIFLFGYFFLMKPSKESLIQDMRLSSEESDLILKS
jgi:predicted membrane channel-forming protein YqfA (hemolysin III family)